MTKRYRISDYGYSRKFRSQKARRRFINIHKGTWKMITYTEPGKPTTYGIIRVYR